MNPKQQPVTYYTIQPKVHPYYLCAGQSILVPEPFHVDYCINASELMLSNKMRRIWQEHVSWMRTVISGLVFNLPDSDNSVARLSRTATDMGIILRPYYGDKIADQYEKLLKEHISLAGKLVAAVLKGKKAAEIEEKWYKNGDEIAAFLSMINPYIIKDKFQAMFHEHLDMIRLEFQYMLSEDFKTTVKVSDEMVIEALEMADYLTWAISKQFSNEFY